MTIRRRKSGFTLVEVLIVVVIMAILAATIIPQFSNTSNSAKISAAQFNLQAMRSMIETYRAQHAGAMPSLSLAELMTTTNSLGAIGTGTSYPYGPYMSAVPMNSITNSNTVVAGPAGGAVPTSVIAGAGWQYDVGTGKIYFNDNTLVPFAQQ